MPGSGDHWTQRVAPAPGPGSRVSEHCESPGNTGTLSRHQSGTGNSLRDFPPFSATPETPELLTKICLSLGWTVAEMGQRILMGILLSSGTISITQTFYYDQRCDIVTYMFDIGGYLEHLNKNIASMRDARNNIGLRTQIDLHLDNDLCNCVKAANNKLGNSYANRRSITGLGGISCYCGSIRKQLCVSR